MTSFVSLFDGCVCFCTNQPAHLSRSSPGVGFHPNLHPNQGFIRVRDIYCCCVNWFQNMPELYRIAHYLQPSPTSSPVSRTCEVSEKSEAFLYAFLGEEGAHERGSRCCLREFRASADARVPFPQGKGTKGCRGPARFPCGVPAPMQAACVGDPCASRTARKTDAVPGCDRNGACVHPGGRERGRRYPVCFRE